MRLSPPLFLYIQNAPILTRFTTHVCWNLDFIPKTLIRSRLFTLGKAGRRAPKGIKSSIQHARNSTVFASVTGRDAASKRRLRDWIRKTSFGSHRPMQLPATFSMRRSFAAAFNYSVTQRIVSATITTTTEVDKSAVSISWTTFRDGKVAQLVTSN